MLNFLEGQTLHFFRQQATSATDIQILPCYSTYFYISMDNDASRIKWLNRSGKRQNKMYEDYNHHLWHKRNKILDYRFLPPASPHSYFISQGARSHCSLLFSCRICTPRRVKSLPMERKKSRGRNEDTSPFPRNTCNICDIYHFWFYTLSRTVTN